MTQPTDWVSSIVYSRKASGQLRICLNLKDLNKAVKRPHYRTPTLDEVTHKLAGAKLFSMLDARHGYWSVSLDEESSLKTTFNSPFGRFCFTRLPFGLNLSQDVFQERMDNILEHCTMSTMSIADDVGVFGKDEAEYDANLHNLMKTARRHGLVFNISLPTRQFVTLNRLRCGQARCAESLHRWGVIASPACPCGESHQTTRHIFEECPLTAFPGGLQRLHQAGPDTVEWLSRLSLKL